MTPLSRLATRARAAGLWQPFLADCRTAAWALPVAAAFLALVWIASPDSPAASAVPVPASVAEVPALATGGGK